MQIFLGLIAYLTASAVLVGGLLFAAMLYVAVPEQQRSAPSAMRTAPTPPKVARTMREPTPAPQTDRQASAPKAAEPAATTALEVGAAQALAVAPAMAAPAPIAAEAPDENAAKQQAAERAKARKEARRQAKRKAQRAIAARQREEQQWVDRQWDGRPPLGYAGRYTERRSNLRDGGFFPFFRD